MTPRSKILLPTLAVGILIVVGALAALGPRAATAPQESEPTDVLAKVGDTEITRAEVEEAAADNLRAVDMQLLQCQSQASQNRHRALEMAIDQMVTQQLIEKAAAAAGQEPDAWQAAQIAEAQAAISDQQVTDWYNQNRSRLRGATQEQVADQIRQFLAQEAFTESLRGGSAVEVMLEPFRVDVEVGDAPTKGKEGAPITIVEFSDFECPFCQRVVPTLDRVVQEYGDQVQLAFRQYPLDNIHPNARKAAEASLCADDQGKFWEMHDLMFAEQKDLGVESLREKASRLGLDVAAFNECLDSGRHAEQVEEDLRAGVLAGVSGTPYLFVNGRPLNGAVPFEQFAEVIDEELERLGIEKTP